MPDYSNSFVLFRNDKKGNEKAPDYRGNLTLADGEKKEIAAWVKEGKNGSKFLAGRISEPYKKAETKEAEQSDNGDLPF